MVSAPLRRDLVRHMSDKGLRERRVLRIMGISASYQPAMNRNCARKKKIITLAHRHRRYGVGMIYLKLRQIGEIVNLTNGWSAGAGNSTNKGPKRPKSSLGGLPLSAYAKTLIQKSVRLPSDSKDQCY